MWLFSNVSCEYRLCILPGFGRLILTTRGELSDETNESRAFSFFPLMLNAGTLVAAYVGGEFSNVAIKHPWLSNALFARYPYLLPNLIAGAFPLISAIICFFWLEETLPSRSSGKVKLHADIDADQGAIADAAIPPDLSGVDEGPAPRGEIFNKRVNIIMFSFGVLSLMGSAILGIHPLFCFTPTQDGGLNFREKQIGDAMSIRSISVLIVQVVAFPWLQPRVGTWRLYRILMFFWIPTFLCLPLCNLLARGDDYVGVWSLLTFSMICGAIANMAFVCNLLIVNEAAPTRRSLGAINGTSHRFPSVQAHVIGYHGHRLMYRLLSSSILPRPYHRSRRRVHPFRRVCRQADLGR